MIKQIFSTPKQNLSKMTELVSPEWLSDEGMHTLSSGYLLPGETPRDMMMRIASTAATYNQDSTLEEDVLHCLWEGWIGGSSPTLSNFGTNRGYPISCLETGTRIHTKDGFKEIQDLKPGDLVLTHLGNWKPVLNVWSRQTDNDLYLLSLSNRGGYSLNITGNHPVLTNKGWVKVEDLDPKEHQICTEPITDVFRCRTKRKNFDFKIGSQRYNKGSSYLSKNSGCFKVKEIPNCGLDHDLAWWFGLWFAEGHTVKSGTIGISMGWDEEEYLDRWLSIAKDKFGLTGTKSIYANPRGHQHAQARIHNKYLQEFFDKEFGKGCRNKILPEWFFDLPDDTLKAFAEGFIIGDGRIVDGGEDMDSSTVTIGIANEKLCYQLWYIFTLLGRFPGLSRAIASYHKRNNEEEVLNFEEHGCFWNYLPKRIRSGKGLSRSFKISKQERETTVWDIEVADDHSFVAQGVVVHNCYSVHISDNTPSIYSHLKEVAMLSKHGGGVGVYLGEIRPSGAPISGGGKSIGQVPWARQYDLCASVVSQGGVRRGNFAFYTPIDSPDLPELLRSKDHTKGDPRQWIESNAAVTITDDWLQSMIDGDKEKQELFGEVLKTRLMSGSPYIIFIDNANRQNPKCYVERGLSVKTSNLCFTGDTLAVLESGETVTLAELAKDAAAKYHVACSDVEHDYFKGRDVRSNVEGGSFATAFRTRSGKVVKVSLEDGGSLRCTPDHLLATQNGQWREAQASLGDVLYTQDGKGVKVTSVEDAGFEENLYCLNVDTYHNFFIKVSDTANVAVRNCSEIFLHTDEHHTFVCVLSSLNLSKYDEYKDWKSPISGRTVPQIGIHLLEAVVSEFIRKAKDKVGMGRSVRFAEKSRALGLGVMGLHTLYQKRGLPFKSKGARELNIEAHKWIRQEAEIASRELAEKFGEPEWCRGSGMRHTHLLAIAPTRTNSVISGAFSQGVEPVDRNLFVAKQAKGTYVRKNPVLEKLFCERGIGPEVWDQILENKGSVQSLDCLTDEEKEIFKTAREIDQFELVKQAADRQPFICQGQSLNLFVDPEADAAYLMRLHLSAWKMGLKSLYYLKSSSLLTKKRDVSQVSREGGVKAEKTLMVTKEGCPWCVKLKEELNKDGIPYDEINLDVAKEGGTWDASTMKTVPQLKLFGQWVGGYTDYLKFKESAGTLHEGWAANDGTSDETYNECSACEA